MDERRGAVGGAGGGAGSSNGGGLGGMFRPARMKIPVGSLMCWSLLILLLLFYPPSFIGDYNVRICVLIFLWIVFNTVTMLVAQSVADPRVRVGAIVGLLILFPVVAVYSLSSFSSWCCVNEGDFTRLCNLAARTTDRLQANEIPYWVCWGSLLGAVREFDMPFQAVPWEHDFDICIYERDWDRFVSVMHNSSDLIFDEKKKIVFDTNYRTTLARAYVDVYKYAVSETHKGFLETREGSHDIKRTAIKTIEPLAEIRACNRFMVGPANPIQAVEDIYGKSFRTPMWPPGITGWQCRAYTDCRLPRAPN